jgi:hypothetical protein
MNETRLGDFHSYREVQTPLGRRIKCYNVEDFIRVTRWVAWLKLRQMERNRKDWQRP